MVHMLLIVVQIRKWGTTWDLAVLKTCCGEQRVSVTRAESVESMIEQEGKVN